MRMQQIFNIGGIWLNETKWAISRYFKILVNSDIIGAPKLAEELGFVMHQLIRNNDRIKMFRLAEPI